MAGAADMANWRAVAFSGFLASGLAACAADGPRFEPLAANAGFGTIYVYRPLGKLIGRGESPYVSIADGDLHTIKAGGFMAKRVPAGEYDVRVRQNILFLPTWQETVSVAVAPGGSAYVKVDQVISEISAEDGLSARQSVFIKEVDSITGQAEIAGARENE